MTNTQKTVAGVLVAALLLLIGYMLRPAPVVEIPADVSEGSTVVPNVQWFSSGYKYGLTNALFNSAVLTVAAGTDQVVWKNQTGVPVVVDTTHVVTNATSSASVSATNYGISVGATSTATIREPYAIGWITNAQTPLLISNFVLATTSATGFPAGSLPTRMLADNYGFHPSSSTASVLVPPNWYVFVKVDSICTADGACGKTSTSTNRGFTTLSVPIWYHYASPN